MTWWDGGIDYSPHAGSAPTPSAGTGINNSAAAIYDAYVTSWTAWTPTRTNLTVGNGTEVARYFSIGGRIHFSYSLTLGSTSSVGSLPQLEFTTYTNYGQLEAGIAGCWDGTLWYPVAAHGTADDEIQIETNATYPFTWGTGDVLSASWTFRKAVPATSIGVP